MMKDFKDQTGNKKILLGNLICFLLDLDINLIASNCTLSNMHYYDLNLLSQSFNVSV